MIPGPFPIIALFRKTGIVFLLSLHALLIPNGAFAENLYFSDSATALSTCEAENNKCFNEGAYDGCWLYLRGVPTSNNYIYPAGTCNSEDPCKTQYDAAGICSPAAGVTGLPEELQIALMGLCGAICGFLPMYVLTRNL